MLKNLIRIIYKSPFNPLNMEINSIVLKYGEIALKSDRNRKFFEKLYIDAIKDALKKFKIDRLHPYGKRFTIHHEDSKEMIPILKRIPGIQSFSPAHNLKFENKEDLIQKTFKITKPLIQNKTFRITTKRQGQQNFSSMDFSMELGKILEPHSEGVNLKQPNINIQIEIRNNQAYIYTEDIEGVGGLPPTSAGRVLCLFSGGIDSPVAAYKMLKRGCAVDFLYINLLGDAPFDEIAKVYNQLINNYVFGYSPKFYVIDAADIVKEIKEKVDSTLRQIFLKIIFYKIGEEVSKINKHLAVVTGEALSQKSSQTVSSLRLINSQTDALILRPLLGMDKTEITKIARELGTFEFSEKVKEYCNLSEGPVTTNPSFVVLKKFPEIDLNKTLEEIMVFKGEIPLEERNKDISFEDAEIINLTEENIPNSTKYKYPQILDQLDSFKNKYIIICKHGLRAKDVSNQLHKKGIIAKSLSLNQFKGENISCKR